MAPAASGSLFDLCLPAFRYIDENLDSFTNDLIRICETPAPTFAEEKRTAFVATLFAEQGLRTSIDAAGNLLVPFSENGKPRIVLSAHLDTVFDFQKITVRREQNLLYAPGISDDSSGLAALVYICRALRRHLPDLPGSLLLLASVGEEGLGNLRGVRHFFENEKDVDAFLSLDGCDAERIVVQGPGSKRVRIKISGPGGHSWGDRGLPNPIHSAGELLARIHRKKLPPDPKTVINVGLIRGGTSVNAIPSEMSMDIDLRSESNRMLNKLDGFLKGTLEKMAETAPDGLRYNYEVLGERPSGKIDRAHPLVRKAIAAARRFGIKSQMDASSTDSNIPFSMGIPALTLGTGGRSGKIHTAEEWMDLSDIERGLKRTLFLVVELLHS